MVLPKQPSKFRYPFCDGCALAKAIRKSSSLTLRSTHPKPPQRSSIKSDHVSKPVPETTTELTTLLPWVRPISSPVPLSHFAVDIKGPIRRSIGGAVYFMCCTCMQIRWRIPYYLKTKYQVCHYLGILYAWIRSQGCCLLMLKSDNGGEFVSAEVREWMRGCDPPVQYETTSPYTPHQNGIAERSNRSIPELAIALMITAKVPIYLWPYACSIVIHVKNRFPTKALDMRSTPFIEL